MEYVFYFVFNKCSRTKIKVETNKTEINKIIKKE
jgi:hypothetical protein